MGDARESKFQFSNPVLLEASFSINKEYTQEEMSEITETPLRMNHSKPNIDIRKHSEASSFLTVEVGEEGPDFPYHISVTMGAVFRWDESLSQEEVDLLLSQSAPALLLGYIRPHIAQITGASPIGIVHIPFMNFLHKDQ